MEKPIQINDDTSCLSFLIPVSFFVIKNLNLDKSDIMLKVTYFLVMYLAVLSFSFPNERGRRCTEKLPKNIYTSQYAVIKYDDRGGL
jgi:hypothetical protein